MSGKSDEILRTLNGKKVGVFVDDSNLFHAYQKYGWRIDFERFKDFFGQYCVLQFISYYVAVPDKNDAAFAGTQRFLDKIRQHVTLKTKPLKYTPVAGKFVKKADVDVEITLDKNMAWELKYCRHLYLDDYKEQMGLPLSPQ